jgi:hypothetical protein
MTKTVLPISPFERAMNRLKTIMDKEGRESAKKYLEYMLIRYCVSQREQNLAKQAFEQTTLNFSF